ncbi:MAG TPA: ATP-binding protein [Dokdonella sp.]|uniref:ATP-binding protein n=1 Tax=Dokdonella sp. TaxID=2291710 RepID=UPI002B6A220D|nr:ATP-binding protein [Dokdonella sp.]HUD40826.1 ATP-binding protein [Dokdonella sp.]
MTRRAGAGVVAQLVLVVALTLAGAIGLAALLGRELATRPAAEQLLRALDGFAAVVEALARHRTPDQLAAQLQAAGLATRTTPPPAPPPRLAPFLRELQAQAGDGLGPGRTLALAGDGRTPVVWLQLATEPPLWVSFAYPHRAARRFPLLLLSGCVILVWLAAAYLARRLAWPLRQLAEAAPALIRGEAPAEPLTKAPREVADLADALTRAGEDVRGAAAERAFLLAGISHDLRTPLTRVQYAVELLPDTDPALRSGIQRDIEEIDAILTQFIAYARDGRDEPTQLLDLSAIGRQALAAATADWTVDLPDSAPMRGKPIALLRAIENLIVNAQRHGAPPFSLSLGADGEGWRITVADHGPGLSATMAGRAAQPFVHGGSGGGAGLGLAIVERVARQHGGTLTLQTVAPHGLSALLTLRGARR